jgi:hypothetical protein
VSEVQVPAQVRSPVEPALSLKSELEAYDRDKDRRSLLGALKEHFLLNRLVAASQADWGARRPIISSRRADLRTVHALRFRPRRPTCTILTDWMCDQNSSGGVADRPVARWTSSIKRSSLNCAFPFPSTPTLTIARLLHLHSILARDIDRGAQRHRPNRAALRRHRAQRERRRPPTPPENAICRIVSS